MRGGAVIIVTSAIHITFGTANFSQAARILKRSASRFGMSDVRVYHPDHPALREAWEQHPDIMRLPRGAGYWLWKPYIIRDALRSVPQGTIVLYTDVAVTYIADPAPLLQLAETRDVTLFLNRPQHLQRMWTKRDCFVLLGADTPEHWNRRQIEAGFALYRACPRALAFSEEWLKVMGDPRVLTDAPNACGLPNLDGFREHRHDQSVLTILAARHGIEPMRAPSREPDPTLGEGSYGRIFHLHKRRNANLCVRGFYWLIGQYDGRPRIRVSPRTKARLLRLLRA